jgi:thioredoxin-like negative regulator of GroEL
VRRTLRISAVGLLTAAAVLAAARPIAAEWRRLDSPNFVVVGDVSARTLQDVAVKFEGFRETLTRVLTERATATPVPTVVIVFPSDRAFTPFKPTYKGKPIAISGLFVGSQDANYIAIVADGNPDGLRIVFHEYAHLVVSNVMRSVPSWLSEGLAEYYSTYDVGDGGREAVIGRPIIHHLQRLNETSLLKLDDLLNVDHASPLYNERDRQSVFYAQSWALTHRLLMGEPRRTAELFAYLQRVSEGTPPKQAWEQAFGATNVERELHEYVRRRMFRAVQYKFTEKLAKFDATPTPVSAIDAEAFLSEFLLQQVRPDEVSKRLLSAAKADPEHLRVRTVMAHLDIARSDYENAEKRLLHLGEPTDWLMAYSAGVGIAELVENRRETPSPEHVQAARRLFDVVRQQRGEVPNAAARLAMLEVLSAAGPSAETRTAIERARELAPGREDYAFVHAQVLAHLSEFAAARKILGPLMSSLHEPQVRDAARSLMGHIVQMETVAQNRKERAAAAASGQRPADGPAQDSAVSLTSSSNAPSTTRPSGFRPIFRELQAGEHRLEGMLERIECTVAGSTAVFHIRTPEGGARATARRMADVDFITYRNDLTGSVGCGPVKPPLPVYLTWRLDGTTPEVKLAVAIEFLPK